MKRKYTWMIFVLGLFLFVRSEAQINNPIDSRFIELVEQNSTTLKAYQDQIEATKVGAKTNLNPSNPQVNYVRISDGDNYNEEIEVTQQFDFPTVYTQKRKGSKLEIERLEGEYRVYRQNILAEAYKAFTNYAYALKMSDMAKKRAQQSQDVKELMQKRFENGDITAIELSKAEMESALVQSRLDNWMVELNSVSQDLALFVGDMNAQSNLLSELASVHLSLDKSNEAKTQLKDLWVNSDAAVIEAAYQSKISDVNIGVKRSQSLPKLMVGYRQEKNNAFTMNGPSLGVTIPLWENKNTVKQAKLEKIYAESNEDDMRLKAALQFEKLYQTASYNADLVQSLSNNLPEGKVLNHLMLSLEEGYISLLEYYAQLSVYYDLQDQLEKVKMTFKTSYIDLYKVAL